MFKCIVLRRIGYRLEEYKKIDVICQFVSEGKGILTTIEIDCRRDPM